MPTRKAVSDICATPKLVPKSRARPGIAGTTICSAKELIAVIRISTQIGGLRRVIDCIAPKGSSA